MFICFQSVAIKPCVSKTSMDVSVDIPSIENDGNGAPWKEAMSTLVWILGNFYESIHYNSKTESINLFYFTLFHVVNAT